MGKNIFILLLNWNGAADSIECIESITYVEDFIVNVIIIDNGSTDDSLDTLKQYLGAGNRETFYTFLSIGEESNYDVSSRLNQQKEYEKSKNSISYTLISIDSNLGFAKGNNIGIKYSLCNNADYIFLLNNDTILDENCLPVLLGFLETNKSYQGVTGQIRYESCRDQIWNCGGHLTSLGSRKYLFANANISDIPVLGHQELTFVTGCAFLVRSSLFYEVGLLTERFFFGEEDFEFCRRLRRQNKKLACCFAGIIYHKVSSTIKQNYSGSGIGAYYIYYLNRFIHLRSEWPKFVWETWRIATVLYILPMLFYRYKIPVYESFSMYCALLRNSKRLNTVDQKHFFNALNNNFKLDP